MSDMHEWLQQHQAVEIAAERVADPARSVARIGTMARESAATLSFDTDPTAFWRSFEALAAGGKDE